VPVLYRSKEITFDGFYIGLLAEKTVIVKLKKDCIARVFDDRSPAPTDAERLP
jgi:hypothetical protein